MRTFLILLVLAAVGYAGWSWYSDRQKTDAVVVTNDSQGTEGSDIPSTATKPPVNPGMAALPPEVKADFEQAEILWKQAVKAGQPPAQSSNAPLMGKLYSSVLRGVYNKPGQAAFEKMLLEQRLTPLGNELFFSKMRFQPDETNLIGLHKVQPGESPDLIAKKYGMSMEFINRLRGRDANDSHLNAGDGIKIVKAREKGGYFLHIDRGDYYMDCYIGGVFAKRYVISHGAVQTPTPTGHSKLTDRVLDPSWTHPQTHKVYGPNDPENILGKVWFAFSPEGIGQSGLGIHGYTGPNPQMRAQVSNGCIRMENDSALELYRTLCSPNRCPTEVEIVE